MSPREGEGHEKAIKTFTIGLNKYGIKQTFTLPRTQNLNKLGSYITYAKQDKKLCNSNIYNFKHEEHKKSKVHK
jgi:hypothetical protein